MGRKRPLRSSCAATAAEPVACTKLWPVDRGEGMEKKPWRVLALVLSGVPSGLLTMFLPFDLLPLVFP